MHHETEAEAQAYIFQGSSLARALLIREWR